MTDKFAVPSASPLVSVVIPCYNAEAFVGEAIESVLRQTYSNVEVIVIDDGSTDRSLSMIRSFGDRVRWESGPNKGGGMARNLGLAIARGELVQFLDADDWLFPEKIELQSGMIRESGGAIPCFGRYQSERAGESECCRQVEVVGPELDILAWVIRETQELKTSSPLHRKDALMQVGGFDVELPAAQEYDLHIRLAAHGFRFQYDATPQWMARMVSGSVSSSTARVFDQHPIIFARARQLAERNGCYSSAVAQAIGHILMKDARWYSLNGSDFKMRQFQKCSRRFDLSAGTRFYESNRKLRWVATFIGAENTERLVRLKRVGLASFF